MLIEAQIKHQASMDQYRSVTEARSQKEVQDMNILLQVAP